MSNTTPMTTLQHGGATAKIAAHGATVVSFISADGRENLFLSKAAKLDGSVPIRGGIPICFPIFGPPGPHDGTMPQHGFARRNVWTLASTTNTDTAATAVFTLDFANQVAAGCSSVGENNAWTKDHAKVDHTNCLLTYEVRLEPFQLTTTLTIKNTGDATFNFQALLHTYLAVDQHAAQDASATHINGLGGYAITDKVSGDSGHEQSYDDPVYVAGGEADRVYLHPDAHPTMHGKVAVGAAKKIIQIEAAGQVAEQPSPISCVVWNPGPTKAVAMTDFGNDEYKDMICVEPGLVGHQPLLNAGEEARLTQNIIVPK